MRRWIAFTLGALTSTLVLILLVAWREGGSRDPRRISANHAKERFQSRASIARVAAPDRPNVAPSTPRGHILASGASDELALEQFRDRAVNVYEEVKKGDRRWQSTALRLSDLGYLRDERLQCAAMHALPLRAECRGTIDMVLDPAAGAEAKVVYARASTEANEPDDAPSCAAYVDCLAESRVGSDLPVPPDLNELIAVRQDTIYEWTSPAMFDPSRVEELVDLREEALADAIARGGLDEFDRLSEEQVIRYLHQHLAELREEARPTP